MTRSASLVERKILTVPKETWAGLISSLVEAYNMAIYSFTAPFIAPLIFPNSETWSPLFFFYCLAFVGSCLCYPLGAFYYGVMGDREGRRKTCTHSALGLAIATGLMGVLPLNHSGDLSWICFLLLLGAQNFFSGGEYHGSIVFSLEHANKPQNGFMSATSCLFAVFGLCLANGCAIAAMHKELLIRGCFLLGALGGILSYVLKNYCRETPQFAAVSPASFDKIQLISFFKTEWPAILGSTLILSFYIVSYSFIFIFLPLVINSDPFDTFKSLMAYGILLVIGGILADCFSLKKTMTIGAGLFALTVVFLCYHCSSLLILQSILTSLACLVIGPMHGWMLQQFTVQKRCRGIFISSALSMSLFGGSTVPICLLLFEQFHSLAVCALFPMLFALSCVGYLWRWQPPFPSLAPCPCP